MTSENVSLLNQQKKAWNKFLSWTHDIPSSIPQSIIVEGPEGCGKKEILITFFQSIQCTSKSEETNHPCNTCSACLKVLSHNHLDLVVISPQGQFITVDQLREVKKSLYFSPIESQVRFVLIDQAQRMNASAANSFLKTLEDPSAHTKFFLITPHRRLLLPTIQSRCQFIGFEPLSPLFLADKLREKNPTLSENLIELLVVWMGGGLKKLDFVSSENQIQALSEITGFLSSPAQRKHLGDAALLQLADHWAAKEESENLELRLEWFCCLLGNAMLKNQEQSEALSHLCFQANHLRTRLDGNANRKLIALASVHLIREFQRI